MITFIEHTEPGYALRTVTNARAADLTIAFAVDFTTPGERLTRKAAYGKYVKVDLNMDSHSIREQLVLLSKTPIRNLNIAGNGLYSFPWLQFQAKPQEYLDAVMLGYLDCLIQGRKDFTIRSGGQTGIDEAALKAGDAFGLYCICLAPKNWLFRTADGVDIKNDPDAFCARFGEQYTNNI